MKNPQRKGRTNRLTNREFIFFVEGETEQKYLKHIEKLLNKTLYLKGKSTVTFNPKVSRNLINEAKNVVRTDEVYVLSDIEGLSQQDIEKNNNFIKQFNAFKDLGIDVIWMYSNLTFEVWILQHIDDFFSKPSSNRKNYYKEINQKFGTDYKNINEFKKQKSLEEFYQENITLENLKRAIVNSEKLYD